MHGPIVIKRLDDNTAFSLGIHDGNRRLHRVASDASAPARVLRIERASVRAAFVTDIADVARDDVVEPVGQSEGVDVV